MVTFRSTLDWPGRHIRLHQSSPVGQNPSLLNPFWISIGDSEGSPFCPKSTTSNGHCKPHKNRQEKHETGPTWT